MFSTVHMARSRTRSLPLLCRKKKKTPITPSNSLCFSGKSRTHHRHSFSFDLFVMGNLSTFRKLIEQGKCTHADSIGTRFSLNKKSSRVLRFQENLGTAFPQVPTPRMPSRNIPNSGYTPFGMNQKNSIACVSVCRDKITTQFMKRLHNAWNGTFKFSSLAGSCISVLRDFKPPIIMLPILMAEKDTCILPFPIPPSMATQDPKSSHKLGAY